MTKTRPRQLELPVMIDVNKRTQPVTTAYRSVEVAVIVSTTDAGFHKPASADDQSIYKAISDNYFSATAKQV